MVNIVAGEVQLSFEGREGDGYVQTLEAGLIDFDFLSAAFVAFQPDDGVAVDVGANIGATALLMAHLRPHGQVWALEPSPTTFEFLRRNAAASPHLHVRPLQLALGDREGAMGWLESHADSSASHLTQEPLVGGSVRVGTLDAFVTERGLAPSFVKVDVEGFEVDVLQGAQRTIDTFAPVLFVELNSFTLAAYGRRNPFELVEFLRKRFAQVFWCDERGELQALKGDNDVLNLMHRQFTCGTPVTDLLCIPSGRSLDPAVLPRVAKHADAPAPRKATEVEVLREEMAQLSRRHEAVLNSRTWRMATRLHRWRSLFAGGVKRLTNTR